jgi:tetraacyldisaccharide 4'-kinase
MNLRAAIAGQLEAGAADGLFARVVSRAWGAVARLEAPLQWRETAHVVTVGGATLGGSGKTPLALACAEELHDSNARVVLVGHAYGAAPRSARFVSEQDDVRLVGDEALSCRHKLSAKGIRVTVAPTRQAALDLGLSGADFAVVDGPCQTRPRRAALALLAVDASEPWGAGRCPPRGDLRAPLSGLLAAVDRIVAIALEGAREYPLEAATSLPVDRAWIVSNGAALEGRAIGWTDLGRLRVGLWTALARPQRITRALAGRGVYPIVVQTCADHGPARIPAKSACRGVDLWLCTSKCRTHLPTNLWEAPIATLDHSLRLEAPLKTALARLDRGSARP